MRHVLIGLCAAAGLASGGAALAHHGWGSYDAGRKFTVASAVEAVEWQNPHVLIVVKHDGRDWNAVLAPPFRMSARGLDPDMLKPGTRITVEGYPSTRGQAELRAERIETGGKTYELR